MIQMMKELSRRVSSVLNEEKATLQTIIFGASLDKELAKHQNVVYIPHGTGYKLLDPDSIYDLLNWHEAERKHWKAELEGLLQADLSERQVGYT